MFSGQLTKPDRFSYHIGSEGPRTPRHAIWPGPHFSHVTACMQSKCQTPSPGHWRVYQDRPLASIPTTHLIHDRALGVAVQIWLGALLSTRALSPSLFLCSRPP